MGYSIERRTAKLNLEEYDGAWIRVRMDVALKVQLKILEIQAQTMAMSDTSDGISTEWVDWQKSLTKYFADNYLLEWNLEEDGAPIPATSSGLETLPIPMVMAIITASLTAGTEVPNPLDNASPNGNNLVEELTATTT